MALARTILALLIAASVAVLPAAGAAAFKLKSQDATEMSARESMQDESMQDEPMHDCCPPEANPCDKAMDNCASMATCALKCFSGATFASSPLSFPLKLAGVMPLFDGTNHNSQSGSPPFRPPRI